MRRIAMPGRRVGTGSASAERAVVAFQDDLDAVIAMPAPLALRMWPALGTALILALLAFAAIARVDVVVSASGRLVADAPPVVLQPIERALLRELRVRPGDRVQPGQVVAVLDSTFTAADREGLAAQQRSLAARRGRLEAELSGLMLPPPPGGEPALQYRLLSAREGVQAARLAAFAADIAGLEAGRAAEQAAAAAALQQLTIAREVEAMRERLLETQVGSRLHLLAARAARIAAEQERMRHHGRLAELDQRITARTAERDAYLRDWRRALVEELATVGPELARIEEQLVKAARIDAMTELTAPRAAFVLEVARRAPGSLVREGEPVVVLVPADEPLVAEIALRSADIGQLRPGHTAHLKIDAFPWRRHGTLPGTLRSVSHDSYPDAAGGAALHRGHIVPTGGGARLPEGAALLPGMTLAADITVGTRSVLAFFLEPLLRGLNESLREP